MPGVFGLDLDKPVLGTDEIGKLARATNPTADQPSQPLNGADHPVCRSNGVHTLAPIGALRSSARRVKKIDHRQWGGDPSSA